MQERLAQSGVGSNSSATSIDLSRPPSSWSSLETTHLASRFNGLASGLLVGGAEALPIVMQGRPAHTKMYRHVWVQCATCQEPTCRRDVAHRGCIETPRLAHAG